MTYETTIQLNAITACVEITFIRTPPIAGTFLDPPEGKEIEILDVWVTKVSGVTYDLERHEIDDGWKNFLDDAAWDEVHNSSIFDILHEVADNEDHYE